jgi:hypothetical protein
MSTAFGSPTDEIGSGASTVFARSMEDIAVDTGTVWKLNRGSAGFPGGTPGLGSIIRLKTFFVSKPILITAGQDLVFNTPFNFKTPFVFIGFGSNVLITLPLKTGSIDNFADGTTNTIVNSTAHGLEDNDVVKIIDSRISKQGGNHVITVIDVNSFSIPITPFGGVDGQCRWTQVEVFITGMANGGTGVTTLTMPNHPFADGDWFNLRNSSVIADATFQVSGATTNTINIANTFTTTSTASANVAHGQLRFANELFFNAFPHTVGNKFMDLQGEIRDGELTSLLFTGTVLAGFELGETRDNNFIVFAANSFLADCFGLLPLGSLVANATDTAVPRSNQPLFSQKSYQSLFELGSNFNTEFNFITNAGPMGVEEANGSYINFNTSTNSAFRGTVKDTTGAPIFGSYFKTGNFGRADAPPTSSVSSVLVVPVSDTSPFRNGDGVILSENSQYPAAAGTIANIIKNTSVEFTGIITVSPIVGTFISATDGGSGTTVLHAMTGQLSGLLVGDFILVGSDGDPNLYPGTHKVLVVDDLGGADPKVTILATFLGTSTDASVTSDAAILFKNSDLASFDQTEPRIVSKGNKALDDSMTLADISFQNVASPLTITIATQDVPVVIAGGAWFSTGEERITSDSNGLATSTGLEGGELTMSYFSSLEKLTGGTTNIGLTILINGIDVTPNPPRSENPGVIQINGTSVFTISTSDTIQMAVVNFSGIDDIAVGQANNVIQRSA